MLYITALPGDTYDAAKFESLNLQHCCDILQPDDYIIPFIIIFVFLPRLSSTKTAYIQEATFSLSDWFRDERNLKAYSEKAIHSKVKGNGCLRTSI